MASMPPGMGAGAGAPGQMQGLPQGLTPHQQMAMAKAQVQGVTDMFNRMADLCFKQCIHKFKEPELNVGEVRHIYVATFAGGRMMP